MTDEQTPANGHDAEDDFDIPEAPSAEVEALQAEVAQLKEQILRIAADAIQKFARDLLGAADNLSRATAHAPKDAEDQVVKNFVLGVEMTEKELQQAFERNGLKKVDPQKGDKFDPHLHQAMMEQPAEDVAPGSVIQTMQVGYELFGRIVRPAMVVVAAKG